MFKFFFNIFVFYFLFNSFVFSEKVICDSTKTINLDENEIVFFESPNFPLSINETIKKEEWKLNVRGNSNKVNMTLIFVITNGFISGGQISDGGKNKPINESNTDVIYISTTKPYLNFSFESNELKTWEGFQGFVTYEASSKFKCPLSDKNLTFNFTDESQILYLRSSYFTLDLWPINKVECAWKFLAPEGHGFKIDVLNTTSKVLVVSNNSRDFITRQQPYYYNISKITISYTSSVIHGVLQNTYFTARISIFNPKTHKPEEGCSKLKNDKNKIIWETSLYGYTNDINCQQTIYAPPNFQLYANVTMLELEKNVDILRYYADEELLHPFEINDARVYVFPPKKNNVGRNLTVEFSTDDSVVNKGFKVEFESVECKCGEPKFIIPCEGEQDFSIMENDNFLYCVDLNCNYTISLNESCSNNYALIQTYFTSANRVYDNFQIISDENILLNVTGDCTELFKGMSQSALIVPNRTITLIFQSSSKLDTEHSGTQAWPVNASVNVGKFRLRAASLDQPTRLPKTLITNGILMQIIRINSMQVNSFQTIELSKNLFNENDSLEVIYGTPDIEHMLECITLYDDEDMNSIRPLNVFNTSLIVGPSITIYKHFHCDHEFTELAIKAKNS